MGPQTMRPPLDGSVTVLPGFADFQAEHNPTLPWVVFPSHQDPTASSSISYLEFAEATHRIAHVIRPQRQGPENQVVAILVNCDTILYVALIVGLIRAGMIPFPMSPRNSAEAVCDMMEKTGCHRIIVQRSVSTLTSAVQSTMDKQGYAVEIEELPSLQDIFPSVIPNQINGHAAMGFQPYPASRKSHQANDLVLYLHSSGSTGLPKCIPVTEEICLQWADSSLLRMSRLRSLRWASMAFPTFHHSGMMMQVLTPLCTSQRVALYTPQAPSPPVIPNSQNILDAAISTGCDAMGVVPVFIEMWTQSPEAVKYLASLRVLGYAGGPLSEANGNKLTEAGVELAPVYGLTELGPLNRVLDVDHSPNPPPDAKTPADWAWMQLDEQVKPRWIDQGDGTYELQLLTCDTHKPSIENLPDVPGCSTKDLFQPHPTKKGLWRVVGRADDVIVLRSGEKIVPLPQEGHINSLSTVAGAIVFGRGRSQPGIVIELRPEFAIDPKDESAVIAFRNQIWPDIEEANKRAPTFARLFKETILVADPAKPFARAAKGTVIRKVVTNAYAEEINELYDRIEESAGASGVDPPEAWASGAVEVWLLKHAASINGGREPSSSIDLFEQGFDSLSSTFLRNRIIAALRSSGDRAVQSAATQVPPEFIFLHPTLGRLASAITGLIHPEDAHAAPASVADEVRALITQYSADMPVFTSQAHREPHAGTMVLLTGSTGALGCHLLASLLSDDSVAEVITLNRGSDVADRQKGAFEDKGLPTTLLSNGKLIPLVSDLSRPDLGLDMTALQDIRKNVTHIIHNAWKVDFNLSVNSFNSYIANTRNLIDFCASCTNAVRFIYTSSISSVAGWDIRDGPVPEQVIDNPNVSAASGYGASKHVVEHIVARASRNGLSAVSARIGQICGSTTTGAWNTTEWVPILVKTSVSMGCAPDLDGSVSWIPMDTTAQTIVDAALSSSAVPEVFNVIHPRPVLWDDVFTAINATLGNRLQFVPLAEWVKKVEVLSLSISTQDVETYPAIKILGYFKAILATSMAAANVRQTASFEAGGFAAMQSAKAQALSHSLHVASQIGQRDVDRWMRDWTDKGFLRS